MKLVQFMILVGKIGKTYYMRFFFVGYMYIKHYQPMCREQASYPAGILRRNNVLLTSMRSNDVPLTSLRRHYDVMCPLGNISTSYFIELNPLMILVWNHVRSIKDIFLKLCTKFIQAKDTMQLGQ